jgi:hypothetical protein
MAITRVDSADLSVFTWGSGPTSLVALLQDVSFELPADVVEGRGITYKGENPQAVKQGGIIRTTLMSSVDSCTRVANVDVTAFTLDGVNYAAYLRGGSCNVSYNHDEGAGVGDYWKSPIVVWPMSAGFEVTLNLPDSGTANALQDTMGDLLNATAATAIANRQAIISITINAVAITYVCLIENARWSAEGGKLQTVTFTLKAKHCAAATDHPTAPTGTTSLLEKALNAPKTALAFVLTPKATNSTSFAGEMVFSSYGFDFNDSQLIAERYEFLTHGAVTATGN